MTALKSHVTRLRVALSEIFIRKSMATAATAAVTTVVAVKFHPDF